MASVCIICQSGREGERVADTLVIRAIRSIKERLRIASGNTLVVCPACIGEHTRRVKAFERHLMTHLLIVGLLMAALILVPLLSGSLNLGSFLIALALGGVLSLLGLVGYVPPLENPSAAELYAPAAPAAPAPASSASQGLLSSLMGRLNPPSSPSASAPSAGLPAAPPPPRPSEPAAPAGAPKPLKTAGAKPPSRAGAPKSAPAPSKPKPKPRRR